MLFVAGCEENQVAFHPRFDLIILLSAPAEVLLRQARDLDNDAVGDLLPGGLIRRLADLKRRHWCSPGGANGILGGYWGCGRRSG